MLRKLTTFIKYNNALPLAFLGLFLGFGGALAANDELREAATEVIISKEVSVESVDNSFIINTNLDQFVPSVQITNITEDNENYYISYTLGTIDLSNGAWKVVSLSKEFTVSKTLLGREDLGVYVAEETREMVDRQVAYLKEVQKIERKNGETQKVVATLYSGLIGKYLDSKKEVIEGYTPIQKPQETVVQTIVQNTAEAQSASVLAPQTQIAESGLTTVVSGSTSVSTGNGSTMVMIGNNPAKVPTDSVGGGYSDNGVRAHDNKQESLSVQFAVDGVSMQEVQIDTRKIGIHKIKYTASDREGNIMALERIVIVYDRYKTIAPAITLLGDVIVNSVVLSTYSDAGAIAIDYDDGDLTKNITVENTVDIKLPGTYKVLYNVTDSNGNKTTVARVVIVGE